MNAKILAAVAILGLCGCATSYQQDGFTGGFSETRLAPDTVRVTFTGNGWTSEERVTDFALLRAAQLCRDAGFAFFSVQSQPMANPVATYNGGVVKREIAVMAKFLRVRADDQSLDAAFVISSIKSKYKMQ